MCDLLNLFFYLVDKFLGFGFSKVIYFRRVLQKVSTSSPSSLIVLMAFLLLCNCLCDE